MIAKKNRWGVWSKIFLNNTKVLNGAERKVVNHIKGSKKFPTAAHWVINSATSYYSNSLSTIYYYIQNTGWKLEIYSIYLKTYCATI